jgi:hypothetical protein
MNKTIQPTGKDVSSVIASIPIADYEFSGGFDNTYIYLFAVPKMLQICKLQTQPSARKFTKGCEPDQVLIYLSVPTDRGDGTQQMRVLKRINQRQYHKADHDCQQDHSRDSYYRLSFHVLSFMK